jgi:hypothetical protein
MGSEFGQDNGAKKFTKNKDRETFLKTSICKKKKTKNSVV